jgi:competence ComEA-like helix-hairpin-helix protein
MRPHNSNYFNTYTRILKLAAAVILMFFALFGCAKVPQQVLTVEIKEKDASHRLNLNTATAEEIEKLPDIGPKLALRVVEYRERFGPFRDASQVILVRGMSDQRFRKIRELVDAR